MMPSQTRRIFFATMTIVATCVGLLAHVRSQSRKQLCRTTIGNADFGEQMQRVNEIYTTNFYNVTSKALMVYEDSFADAVASRRTVISRPQNSSNLGLLLTTAIKDPPTSDLESIASSSIDRTFNIEKQNTRMGPMAFIPRPSRNGCGRVFLTSHNRKAPIVWEGQIRISKTTIDQLSHKIC